ncbi:MAG: exodeoxyribonuclease III [Burkholderiales bacterium]|nr:exodeoxyribonuclease III [Burkholderiales bacterium]
MLRIITANVNGLRSAAKKGFIEWLQTTHADLICLQEIKAQSADLSPELLNPSNYQGVFQFAQKKGYSGTGIYSKHTPDEIQIGFGESSPDRQEAKWRFLKVFLPHLQDLKNAGMDVLLCGDMNIAHQEVDLKNWQGNLKNSGFLPEERAWLTHLFSQVGFCDVYRTLEPGATKTCYTWWSQRGQAYNNNVGWRIDYQIATPAIAQLAKKVTVYKDTRFSDHAPLIVDYDYSLGK